MPGYAVIEEKIRTWAIATPDIKAVFVIGSRGRKSAPPPGADLDIFIVTSSPERYRDGNLDWSKKIEKVVWGLFQPDTHMIFESSSDFIVLFDKDTDVDFSFMPLQAFQREIFVAGWLLNIPGIFPKPLVLSTQKKASAFHDGFRVLIDKIDIQKRIQDTFGRIPWRVDIPTPNEFFFEVNQFLLYAFKAAKKIQSGKSFHAKWMVDTTLKYQFIRAAEWHIRSQNHQDDTNRFRDLAVDEWADVRVITDLKKINSDYRLENIRTSLLAMIDLFYWVMAETATNLKYVDVLALEVDRFEHIKQFVQSIQLENNL